MSNALTHPERAGPPKNLEEFVDQFGTRKVSYAHLVEVTDVFTKAINAATKRIAALEATPATGVGYGGTHETSKAYSRGVLVTRQGSLWLSLRDTTSTPGESGGDWKLVVKRGGA